MLIAQACTWCRTPLDHGQGSSNSNSGSLSHPPPWTSASAACREPRALRHEWAQRSCAYRVGVEFQAVRDAYSRMSGQYIDLFDEVSPNDPDAALIRKYLTGLPGLVLDLGCGPGLWTAHLHGLGVDVIGIDVVPEFVAHARVAHPGPEFRLGSLIDGKASEASVEGILAWYSLIHLPPAELGGALAEFRRLLTPAGMLVLGFFDSDDGVASFDHKVVQAYRWPADALVAKLAEAGFTEVERVRRQVADRPDRRYAAVVARAS